MKTRRAEGVSAPDFRICQKNVNSKRPNRKPIARRQLLETFSMKSPFPGMDPFIEAFDLWGDFHDKLIGDLERVLSERVPERYVLRLNPPSYIPLNTIHQNA